jgi:hypothetical protein
VRGRERRSGGALWITPWITRWITR